MNLITEFFAYAICFVFWYCQNSQNINFLNWWENYFVTIWNNQLSEQQTDEFYQYIKSNYKEVDNIVLISWNHSNYSSVKIQTIAKDWNLCYKNECIEWKTLKNLQKKTDYFFPVFKKDKTLDSYITDEYWIWEQLPFIKKYFPWKKLYPIVVNINQITPEKSWKELEKLIENEKFYWNTLFISSQNFSQFVEEDFALIHDEKSIASINYWKTNWSEMDCPNCLQLLHNLAVKNWLNCYETKDKKFNNWDNLSSSVYWEFTKCNKPKTTPITWIIYWKYFWFEDLGQFYQNWDTKKNPQIFKNNKLYWFDIVAFSWENIEEFKKLPIDYFIWNKKNIFQRKIRNKNILFYTINERDISEDKPNKNKELKIDYKSEFKQTENKKEINSDTTKEKDKKITITEINEELKSLRKQNDIIIVFINRDRDEKNSIFYELSEYADMIVWIWWKNREYERYKNSDIYHSIWNINEYIMFEVN